MLEGKRIKGYTQIRKKILWARASIQPDSLFPETQPDYIHPICERLDGSYFFAKMKNGVVIGYGHFKTK